MHTLELFFTLFHTLPLYDSHLNTGFLNVELQANWHRIKPTKQLIKFNFTQIVMGSYVSLFVCVFFFVFFFLFKGRVHM